MSSVAPPAGTEGKALRRLSTGAGLGLAGALLGLVLPIAFLWLSVYNPGGFFTVNATFLSATTYLVVAGSILLLLSFFLYRGSFRTLHRVDRRFVGPAILCLVGSLGLLAILIASIFLLGSAGSLVTCLHGAPTRGLTCLRAAQPLGGDAALLGLVLGWLGGVGIVWGVAAAGGRYHQGSLSASAGLYALLLLVLIGPLLALVTAVPGVQFLLLATPALAVLAPGLALGGGRRALRRLDLIA